MSTRLFIAYPCYQGTCNVKSMESISALFLLCTCADVKFEFFPLTSESLISRARNVCASAFLQSACTHMLFVDSDIVFDPCDVLKMVSHKKHVVCGLYPKKVITLDDIKQHCGNCTTFKELVEKCSKYACNFDTHQSRESNILIETYDIATGFVLFSRFVFEEIKSSCPEIRYKNDIVSYTSYTADGYMYNFFPVGVSNERYLSEDYGFSHLWRSLGHKLYADISIKLVHIGQFNFYGNPLNTFACVGQEKGQVVYNP